MDKNTSIIIGVVVVVVLAIGGFFLYQSMNKPTTTVVSNQTNQTPSGQTGTVNNPDQSNAGGVDIGVNVNTPKTHEVVYTDAGYSPSTLTIKLGDTVTFKNQSSGEDWVGSAMHPTHTTYSGTTLQQHCPDTANNAFDECKADKPGESWSFTFNKTGTWGYHNHMNAKYFGKIVVE